MDLKDRKRATLKTISEATGFAVTTVARALKNETEINSKTRDKIQSVAAELGYRPDRAAQGLRTGRALAVGLILDQKQVVADFERRIIGGVARVVYGETAHNLVVLPQRPNAPPIEPVRYLVDTAQVDGLIFAHTTPHDERVRYLLDRNTPFVTHGRSEFPVQHAYYDFDNYAFVKRSVERLSQKQRKRIAMIEATPTLTCAGHQAKGFADGLSETGATGSIIAGLHLSSDVEEFRKAAHRLAESNDRPDGIICGIESGAVALLAGLQEAGLVVGRDIDVIARSTSDILDYMTPKIDSFHENLDVAGETLARFLIKRIEGSPVEELQAISEPEFRQRSEP